MLKLVVLVGLLVCLCCLLSWFCLVVDPVLGLQDLITHSGRSGGTITVIVSEFACTAVAVAVMLIHFTWCNLKTRYRGSGDGPEAT